MAADARTLWGEGRGWERVAIEERHALKLIRNQLVELFVVLTSRGHSHHVAGIFCLLCAHMFNVQVLRITAGNRGIESMCYMVQLGLID